MTEQEAIEYIIDLNLGPAKTAKWLLHLFESTIPDLTKCTNCQLKNKPEFLRCPRCKYGK